jgi:hypothetical protein
MPKTNDAQDTEKRTGPVPKVEWDDSNMKTSYANVCNASSTREEVTLLFGTNQSWHAGQETVTVQLSDRLILNPFAAKRLSMMLDRVIEAYEQRFGALELMVQPPARTPDA